MTTAVRVTGLMRHFADRRVLDGLNLEIQPGEFVALLGRSGSGKSTLLRALAGLERETNGAGEIRVPESLSVIFQDARLLPWKRVIDNVTLGLEGRYTRERGERALAEVELAGRGRSWPYELSGGEQQRVALARSLVRSPSLLLADEPFGALDALTRIRMHILLRRISDLHKPAVLLVTHDVDEAIELADRVVVLDQGQIAADIPIESTALDDARIAAFRSQLLGQLGVYAAPPRVVPRPAPIESQRVSPPTRNIGELRA